MGLASSWIFRRTANTLCGQCIHLHLDTGERLLRNRIYLRELTENPDILSEEFIHECVSNLPRRSERIAAKVNQAI